MSAKDAESMLVDLLNATIDVEEVQEKYDIVSVRTYEEAGIHNHNCGVEFVMNGKMYRVSIFEC